MPWRSVLHFINRLDEVEEGSSAGDFVGDFAGGAVFLQKMCIASLPSNPPFDIIISIGNSA